MTSCLNDKQLQYVYFHLNQHFNSSDFHEFVSYGSQQDEKAITFNASNNNLDKSFNIDYKGEPLPILFPCSNSSDFYSIKNNQLIFHHDILKATFYLLSGYQEHNSNSTDEMGRFKYEDSIQQQLQIVQKPIVNYYFEFITDAFEQFAKVNNMPFKRKRLFDNFGFMLTHDVDRVDYYHWRETAYKLMQLLGLKKPHYDKKRLAKATFEALLPTIFPGYKNDPWWNFKSIRKLERTLNIKSAWYFLNRDGSPHDAKYHLEEQRIKNLIFDLSSEGCEIGLHGSIKTATETTAMIRAKSRLDKLCHTPAVGTRQHFLKFHYPSTLKIQEEAGLQYDTTMGFAEHEGFRNSYCYPFRPYDHNKDEMLNIWEFPLTIMDTTLFGYRQLTYGNMKASIDNLMEECQRFGGLMVMLWHNCNFDENQYPGITNYYNEQLKAIIKKLPEVNTGIEIVKKL